MERHLPTKGPQANVNRPEMSNCKPEAAGKRFNGTQLGMMRGQKIVRTPLHIPIQTNVQSMTV